MFSFRVFGDFMEVDECGFPDLVEVGAKQGDAFGVELVDSAGAGFGIAYESGVFEDFEVLRDGGTADRHPFRQVGDGQWSGGEELEDRHAVESPRASRPDCR